MSKNLSRMALFLTVSMLTAATASAANLTANPSNDDCADGTGGLQECLDVAVDNGEADTIQLEAGSYLDGTYVYNAAISAEDSPLTLVGPASGEAIIDGVDQVLGIEIFTSGVGDSNTLITIQGLSFTAGGDNALQISSVDADILIESNQFSANNGTIGGAVNIQSSASGDITVRGNTFIGNVAASTGGAIFLSPTTGFGRIENNLIDGNSSEIFDGGAVAVDAEGDTAGIIITNNVIFGSETGGDGGGVFVEMEDDGELTLTNNTLFNNSSDGNGGGVAVALSQDLSAANIYNNIVYGNTAGGDGDDIYVNEDASGNMTFGETLLFNNLYSDFFSVCQDASGSCVSEGGNVIGQDPLFVDSAAGDFQLTANSPARGAGDPDAPEMPSTDFNGDPRPDEAGTNPDIGAFEFQAPAPTPTPTPTPTSVPNPDLSGGGCSLGGGFASLPAVGMFFGWGALALAGLRLRKRR